MNELSLFTGIGGGILGSILNGWRTVCAVEKDPYCREVLLRRQRDGVLPMFPIWDDAKTFDGKPWFGAVDIITAGFPCQPFSVAGKRKGESDERNMWPDTIRIIREVRPRFALLENVPGLLATRYFGRILGDISESGYDAEWDVISAADVGAPHWRKRLWVLLSDADQSRGRFQQKSGTKFEGQAVLEHDGEKKFMADANGSGFEEQRRAEPASQKQSASQCASWWASEPSFCRMANGVSFRVDRLRGLGNAQVPAVVKRAWEILMGE